MLRNNLIKVNPEWISPSKRYFSIKSENNRESIYYENNKVSRNIEIPFPTTINGQLSFEKKSVPFINGLIDIHILEDMIKKDPITLSKSRIYGLSIRDRKKLRFGLGIVGQRAFEESLKSLKNNSNPINAIKNNKSNIKYDYNDIGI